MSKNSKKNKIYLQFLLALVRRRLDILDPSKEDVVPAQQLFQLQPLLDLLSQDLENVGRGCGAGSHVPADHCGVRKSMGWGVKGASLASGSNAYIHTF